MTCIYVYLFSFLSLRTPYFVYDINAADLLSILARHTGHFNLIFVAQSSHRQTWPHGKQMTCKTNEEENSQKSKYPSNTQGGRGTILTSFGLLTQTTHFCSSVKWVGFTLDRCRRSLRARSSVSLNCRSSRSCFLRK